MTATLEVKAGSVASARTEALTMLVKAFQPEPTTFDPRKPPVPLPR